jgi:hypothetical protein
MDLSKLMGTTDFDELQIKIGVNTACHNVYRIEKEMN